MSINFTPTANGLWVHHIKNPQYIQDVQLMLLTVSEEKKMYTKQAFKHALLAQKLQNIMQPSTCSYQDSISGLPHYKSKHTNTRRYIQSKSWLSEGYDSLLTNAHVWTGVAPVHTK
jgi:hypothetical protein